MTSALTEIEITDIFGILRGILYTEVSTSKARTIAAESGFDPSQIPDGLEDDGKMARRAPIFSGIDGQWGLLSEDRRKVILPRLAKSLTRYLQTVGRDAIVNERLLDIGLRFENGGFVPVDATGNIPTE